MIIYNVVIISKTDAVEIRFDDFDRTLAFVSFMQDELNVHLKIEIYKITGKQNKKIYEYESVKLNNAKKEANEEAIEQKIIKKISNI